MKLPIFRPHYLLPGILCLVACMHSLRGQILPPDFRCIRGDTLIWSPASNPCGPFRAYEIYYSPDQAGPFVLLARVTDPAVNFFFHANPSASTWYYFLQSDHNCPGLVPLTSDTLVNRSPDLAPIQSVSVEPGGVRIRWAASPSPQVSGYIIYRATPIGTLPVDTVYGGLSYLDTQASPATKSETYYVVALDPCGNTSLFDRPHSTIYMVNSFERCRQTIMLQWNLYQNWPSGIGRHEVWLQLDGQPAGRIADLGGTVSEYTFQNADDGREYCFTVRAIDSGGTLTSVSNVVCLKPDLVQPMRQLFIRNVSVTSAGELELSWLWDTNAKIIKAAIHAGQAGAPASLVVDFPLSTPLKRDNQYLLSGVDAGQFPYAVSIQSTDQCDTVFKSAFAKPIFLSGKPVPGPANSLQWTALEIANTTVNSYSVFKLVNNNPLLVANLDGSTLSYDDPVAAGQNADDRSCYFVESQSTFLHPDGTIETLRSRSNVVCLSQPATVYVPNAFVPRGLNQVFRPVIVFGQAAEYRMAIYNRWGGLQFETSDPGDGWNGKVEGKDAPAGPYTYAIRLRQPDGQVLEKTGVLILIR
jgi:gliding motility-associated-like protein